MPLSYHELDCVLRIWLDHMRACSRLHCLNRNTLKMQLNCSALKPKHVRLGKCCCMPGFVRKKTFWPLWLLFTNVSLQSICASPLGACRATSAIYSVCVFNTSTPVTCQRPHKLVNPIGFVRLLRTESLIVLMGGRKKARGKEKKKRRWGDEWYLCVQKLEFSNQVLKSTYFIFLCCLLRQSLLLLFLVGFWSLL